MRRYLKNSIAVCVVALFISMLMVGFSFAKSLYIAAEHHTSLFDAWTVNPDGTAIKQATYTLQYSTDPAGIAIDWDSQTLFITSEFSGGVELVDPVSLTYLGVSTGPRNLAGIDVDDMDDIVYTVRRNSNDLYIFSWDPVLKTITQLAQVDLPNCIGAFGLSLDDSRDILWVADTAAGVVRAYDVNVTDWFDIAEIPSMNFSPVHNPVDVTVDSQRNYVYTVSIIGGASVPSGTGSPYLSKYDWASSMQETTVNMGHAGVGVAVDETTGYVYVTGGASTSADNLTVWDTSTTPFTKIQDTGRIGNPAGLAIGNISYNPLNLAKNDVIVGSVYVGSTFTYQINFDNPNPFDVTDVTILDTMPIELDFVSATHGGVYDPDTHTVLWDLGTILAGESGPLIELVVKVNNNAVPGTTINNYATIDCNELPPINVGDDEGSPDPGDEPGTPVSENIVVDVDIKPGSCPNPMRLKCNGVLPAAILGTDELDVSTIDPDSIMISREGSEIEVAPIRYNYEDVATPCEGELCDCHDLNGDGYMDLTLKFRVPDLVELFTVLEDGSEYVPLTITGVTNEGTPIIGEDCIRLLKFTQDLISDLDCDADVDGSDAAKFKEEFGKISCSEEDPCVSDFQNDGDVDGSDALTFKSEFGTILLW